MEKQEIWKPLVGYKERYEISSKGRIKSKTKQYPEGRLMKESLTVKQQKRRNYIKPYVNLSKTENRKEF